MVNLLVLYIHSRILRLIFTLMGMLTKDNMCLLIEFESSLFCGCDDRCLGGYIAVVIYAYYYSSSPMSIGNIDR